MLIDLSCPVENRGTSVRTNSDTQENYLLLKLFNLSEKTIVALSICVKAFDENGNEIASIPVELTELCANPKEFFAENKAISIADIPDARNFIAEVTQATFENGEIYEPSEENTISYDDSEASLQDALLLRELVPDAVCYSSEHENHWRCTCGRPNFNDAENCVRCGRKKDTVLADFSSKTALNNALLAAEEEKKQIELEKEMAQAAKKKKTLKNIITAGILIVALGVLFVIGYFARIGIVNILAGNAAKDGDYLKAYDLYSKVNSSKISEVTDKVIGNNPSNLMFGAGFLAEDEENIYYITRDSYSQQPVNLIKERKISGEKSVLTDAAYGCLNVAGDYIYFINNESYPCRMTKDGKSTETLIDTQMYYMCVVGNDIYYLKTDYDNPKGLTEEECEILASQGQIETFTRIYKLNLDTKKDTLVSEESVYMFSIYGDKIYYLTPTDTEDTWAMANLKSMNLKGKDIKTIVDSPVTSFLVKDDVLYYISCFDESLKGTEITDMSSYDYSIVALNLSNNEKKVISDEKDLILDMNISGDSVIMICYNRDEFFNYYSGQITEDAHIPVTEIKAYDTKAQKITAIAKEDTVSINICGDEIFAILTDGSLTRLDGTEFKIIDENGEITEPITDTDLELEE